MLRKFFIPCVIGLVLAFSLSVSAGNPEIIHPTNGSSVGWENSLAIPYWIDKGDLGLLTNEQARRLVEEMLGVWEAVPTATVGFSFQGELPEDVTEENIEDYMAMASCGNSERTDIPQDVVPVVFDSDGKILEALTGSGSSGDIGGISTLRCFTGTASNPRSIYQGLVIINGKFLDGMDSSESPRDLSVNGLAGVILHEFGHLIGLDHTTLNEEIYDEIYDGTRPKEDSRFLPIMMPVVLRSSASSTMLKPDDIAAISSLYPSEGFRKESGSISGDVKNAALRDVQKVNVVARNYDDPICEAFSAVTGRRCVPLVGAEGAADFNMTHCGNEELTGDYALEGLPAGNYSVEIEDLPGGWIRLGMFPGYLDADLTGDAEFFNLDDAADESPYLFNMVSVKDGLVSDSINFVLSDTRAAKGQLDRIPINAFNEGPSSRCLVDTIDYSTRLDLPTAISSNIESSDNSGESGGGCSLISARKGNIFEFCVAGFLFACLVFIRNIIATKAWRSSVIIIIITLTLLFSPSVSWSTSIIPTDLPTMTKKAGMIFYGRCKDVKVATDERGLTSTIVTYEVFRGSKGVDPKEVTFKVFGSASGMTGRVSTIRGMPLFYVGREDVLFLYKESELGFTSPIGFWQGALPVIGVNGKKVLLNTKNSERITVGYKSMKNAASPDISTPHELLDEVDNLLKDSR